MSELNVKYPGLTPESLAPDPASVVNGINLERVAKIVSGRPVLGATGDEWRIAELVRKYGEKIEREGYMPAFRRPAMLRKMVELAGRVEPL